MVTTPTASRLDVGHRLASAIVAADPGPDRDRAIAAAAHHWLHNRHQLTARLDSPAPLTIAAVLAVLEGTPPG